MVIIGYIAIVILVELYFKVYHAGGHVFSKGKENKISSIFRK